MKKLLLICILIVSIIFISGCTSEEKTNSETSTNLQTSDLIIKPSDLPKGYYSSEYTTYAITQGDSFIIQNFDFSSIFNSKNMYEGDIPSGKKRILTFFKLNNYDNDIPMVVNILEFDSNSGLQDYFSSLELDIKKVKEEKEKMWDPNVSNLSYEYEIEASSVGDYSFQYTYFEQIDNDFIAVGLFEFGYKNYLVKIIVQHQGEGDGKKQKETIQKETLKVAEAIKSTLD